MLRPIVNAEPGIGARELEARFPPLVVWRSAEPRTSTAELAKY
jgi:hypothetical protein